MDRLDQFAAAALTELLAARETPINTFPNLAEDAFDITAAMIQESARRNADGSRKEEAE
jgi:hypothetical protein